MIVQFWEAAAEALKTHLYRVSLDQGKYIHKFQFEKDLCKTVSIV